MTNFQDDFMKRFRQLTAEGIEGVLESYTEPGEARDFLERIEGVVGVIPEMERLLAQLKRIREVRAERLLVRVHIDLLELEVASTMFSRATRQAIETGDEATIRRMGGHIDTAMVGAAEIAEAFSITCERPEVPKAAELVRGVITRPLPEYIDDGRVLASLIDPNARALYLILDGIVCMSWIYGVEAATHCLDMRRRLFAMPSDDPGEAFVDELDEDDLGFLGRIDLEGVTLRALYLRWNVNVPLN